MCGLQNKPMRIHHPHFNTLWLENMATVLQTIFPNTFSSEKMAIFWFGVHWIYLPSGAGPQWRQGDHQRYGIYPTLPEYSGLQGLYSLSGKTSYRQISWSLEAARLDVAMVVSLWQAPRQQHCRGTCQISERLEKFKLRISRLRDFTRSCGKTSYRLVSRGPGPHLNINTVFPVMGIPMLKVRRSWDRLIFNMGIPILVRRHLYIETGPRWVTTWSAEVLNHWGYRQQFWKINLNKE